MRFDCEEYFMAPAGSKELPICMELGLVHSRDARLRPASDRGTGEVIGYEP